MRSEEDVWALHYRASGQRQGGSPATAHIAFIFVVLELLQILIDLPNTHL